MPFAGNTLEGLAAAVAEAQPGARHQVLYGARHQHLARTGERRDARADVNGNPTDIVVDHFAFAGMEPSTDFDPKRPDLLGNGAGAADAARRSVEGGKNAVAGRLDLMAAKACEIAPDRGVMTVEEITPAAVAERGGLLGRADDVGKENRGEYPVDSDRRPRAGQKLFNRIGDLIGIVADPGR